MMWAVVEFGSKQYLVSEGDKIVVDRPKAGGSEKLVFDKVLLVANSSTKIGMPFVEKAKVQVQVLENFKDKKVKIVKFRRKSRYLRITGHRQPKTKIQITEIQLA